MPDFCFYLLLPVYLGQTGLLPSWLTRGPYWNSQCLYRLKLYVRQLAELGRVLGAKTVKEAQAQLGNVIKGDVLKFTASMTNEIAVAGLPARHLIGRGVEADDGDDATADVLIFEVGKQMFIASVHGEGNDASREREPMLKMLQTAKSPQKSGAENNMPTIIVQASSLKEEQLVGPYQQPEWTTERRFPSTRVYLQETPYEMGVEQWDRIRAFKDGGVEHRFSEEFELGLPGRNQLDVYETWKVGPEPQGARQDEMSVEVRHAFADWGRIPLNPTIYVEYTFGTHGDPDALEGKILLGDEICSVWHYGVNLICEQGLWGDNTTELAASAAVGRTVIDRKLSLGIESEYSNETASGTRGDPEVCFLLGPSVQWRITPKTHLDVAPLFGMTHDSPRSESWIVLGYDFGIGSGGNMSGVPISTKGQ